MTRAYRFLSVAVLFSPLFFIAPQESRSGRAAPDVADLAFMSGDWVMKTEKIEIEEHWTAARGGTLIGMGRTIAKDRTVSFEFLRIEKRKDGLYYVAQPGGAPATAFKLTALEKDRAVFENPAHDFPKVIRYEKNAAGHLIATVAGAADAKEPAETFDYAPMK